MKRSFTLFLALLFTKFAKASDTIVIHQNQFFIDFNRNLVVTNLDVTTINSTWSNSKTHISLPEVCSFLTPIDTLEIGTEYTIFIPSHNSNFALYFTELPIISISTDYTIVDEPKVSAYFKMIESDQSYLESDIGIEYRGASSQSLPKKSLEIEFWTDSTGEETADHTLLGMVKDDDWNLQAMYNEPLRIRSKTNNDLWRMVNTLHYQDKEPEAINGIRMKFVELFINDEYRGLYCLGEKVNRKQLKLKKHNGNIRGELYKGVGVGATTFTAVPSYDNYVLKWGEFEYKHPDEETDWSNLHGFVDFVINSSNEDFYDQYRNYFDLDNLVDYYIFLNLLRASDNTGKNLYIAKYNKNSKYFYTPWDLDGTFGINWTGANENITEDLLSNGFYDRLIHDCGTDGFMEKLQDRWFSLRSNVINHDSLMSLFTFNHDYLKSNGIYGRENFAWPDYSYNPNDMDYISDWITNRLSDLDARFSEDCVSISFNEKSVKANLIKLYPNPTEDLIFLSSKFLDEYQVSVYNNLGQVILRERYNQPNATISFKDFDSGIYYVKGEDDKHSEVHKVVLY